VADSASTVLSPPRGQSQRAGVVVPLFQVLPMHAKCRLPRLSLCAARSLVPVK